jgi:pilus assembly protein CpaC
MWGNFIGGMFSGRAIQSSGVYQLANSNAFSTLLGFQAGKSNIQAMIDALDQEGLITMLAEPNLTAISGETASFLAGGEFPIPVAQNGSSGGSISVEFKQFGVSLNFTPTVLADNRISLKVNPEVSQLDSSASITTNGVTIPGLSVRRLSTTVELGSGQSFAIGGLLTSDASDTLSALPGIGTLPVLGKLFSSRNYQDSKTELVVIVTPYLVNPTDGNRLRTPLDTLLTPSSDIEYGLQRSLGVDPLSGDTPRLVGAAGFVY